MMKEKKFSISPVDNNCLDNVNTLCCVMNYFARCRLFACCQGNDGGVGGCCKSGCNCGGSCCTSPWSTTNGCAGRAVEEEEHSWMWTPIPLDRTSLYPDRDLLKCSVLTDRHSSGKQADKILLREESADLSLLFEDPQQPPRFQQMWKRRRRVGMLRRNFLIDRTEIIVVFLTSARIDPGYLHNNWKTNEMLNDARNSPKQGIISWVKYQTRVPDEIVTS